jgi:hypothetical protein
MLINAPLGISWKTIPNKDADAAAQLAEQTNICWRASHLVDDYCNQPLRATTNTESVYGPDFRLTVDSNGVAHCDLSRWPILQVVSAKVSPATSFPRVWQTMDPTQTIDVDASLETAYGSDVDGAAGVGPRGIYVAPGYVDWMNGRRGYLLQVSYTNGWPHAGITADTGTAPASVVAVDDCTGFSLGSAVAVIFDGEKTETVTVLSASATNGPGTLTLAGNLTYEHAPGVVISTLPQNVQWATMLFAAAQAMTRGATAMSVQAMPGAMVGGEASEEKFMVAAEVLLSNYRRTI